MQQISAQQLDAWLRDAARTRPQLIDVREPWEFDVCHIAGSTAMPLNSLPARWMTLDKEADIVMVCHHGARSFQAGLFLEQQGFSRIINLHGGVAAWAQQVDPAMPRY